MKVGRIKDPLYKDSYFGITPPTFILPFEAPDSLLKGLTAVALLLVRLGGRIREPKPKTLNP